MQKYFFVRTSGKYVKISFSEIVYIEGCRNYLKIVTDSKSYLVLFSMRRVEQFLPPYWFKRVHKSFIVSIDRVASFDSDNVYLNDKLIPVGKQYKGVMEKSVLIFNDTVAITGSIHSPTYPMPFVLNSIQKARMFEAE